MSPTLEPDEPGNHLMDWLLWMFRGVDGGGTKGGGEHNDATTRREDWELGADSGSRAWGNHQVPVGETDQVPGTPAQAKRWDAVAVRKVGENTTTQRRDEKTGSWGRRVEVEPGVILRLRWERRTKCQALLLRQSVGMRWRYERWDNTTTERRDEKTGSWGRTVEVEPGVILRLRWERQTKCQALLLRQSVGMLWRYERWGTTRRRDGKTGSWGRTVEVEPGVILRLRWERRTKCQALLSRSSPHPPSESYWKGGCSDLLQVFTPTALF